MLRAFEDRDAPMIQEVGKDPLIPLISTVSPSGSHSDALAFIARQHLRLRTGVGVSFAIVSEQTGEAVGHIGFTYKAGDFGRASIGYWVSPHHRKQGAVSASLEAISNWALTLPGLSRLELYVEPWNEGSWRAAQRAGFEREGLLRSWEKVGTQRKDMYMYSRLGNQ